MTFKAIAAALLVLLLAAGLYNRAAHATRAAASSLEQRHSFELAVTEPSASHGGLQNATVFTGVVNAARHAGRAARTHVPEPGVLLLLGLALVCFGLRRGNKQNRNPPRR